MESALERKEEEASRNKTRRILGLFETGLGFRVFRFWYSTTASDIIRNKQLLKAFFFIWHSTFRSFIDSCVIRLLV